MKMAAKHIPADVEDELDFLRSFYPKTDEFEWNREDCTGLLSLTVDVGDGLIVQAAGKGLLMCFEKPTPHLKKEILRHLPPIRLQFKLVSTYPEEDCPSFTLTCSWLNFSSLSKLCKHLERLWNPGSVILYNWANFITTETVRFLGISSPYCIVVEDPSDVASGCWDDRAVQDIPQPAELVPSLIEYNQRKQDLLFSDHRFTCNVCFLTQPGKKCKLIPRCNHVYCLKCLLSYIDCRMGEGLVGGIKCPTMNCNCDIPHWLVKEVLPPDLFGRFDQLLLQKSLDQMEDLVYCPRPSCRHPNIKEPESQMGICANCSFCFCILCNKTWHGSETGCDISSKEFDTIRDSYENGSSEDRQALEKQYGKKLKRFIEMMATKEWLDSNTKPCPVCRASVEKLAGCNKMTCVSCGNFFCWLCLKLLSHVNPYRHYSIVENGNCSGRLFEGIINEDEDNEDFF